MSSRKKQQNTILQKWDEVVADNPHLSGHPNYKETRYMFMGGASAMLLVMIDELNKGQLDVLKSILEHQSIFTEEGLFTPKSRKG